MEKHLLKLGIVIGAVIVFGLGSVAGATSYLGTGSGFVQGVDDITHPGVENRHDWIFSNYSTDSEEFNEFRVEQLDMDGLIYRVDVPTGWDYVLDNSGIVFNSLDSAYDVSPMESLSVSAWTPGYSVNDKVIDIAIARTRGGVYSNKDNLNVPSIPEPATFALLGVGGVGMLAGRWKGLRAVKK